MAALSPLSLYIVSNMGPLSSGLQQMSAQVHRFSTATRGVFSRIDTTISSLNRSLQINAAQMGIWAAAGGILFSRLISGGLEFQKELVQLGTFLKDDVAGGLGTVQEQLAGYRAEIIRIGVETGQAFGDITQGLSRLIQRGYQGADAIRRLEAAAKFATVAFGAVNESTTAVVKIMDAFGYSTERSEEFFSKLFKAIDIAEAPAQEFAENFVGVATSAAMVGTSLEEALALFALLTFREKSSAEAATDVRRAFETLIKVTKQAEQGADLLGMEFDSTTISTKGLSVFLEELAQGSDKWRGRMLDTRKGLKAFNVAINENAEFQKMLQAITSVSADYFGTKFNFVISSTPQRLKIVRQELERFRQGMVDTLIIALTPAIFLFGKLLDILELLPSAITATSLALTGFLALSAGIAAIAGYTSTLISNLTAFFALITGAPIIARFGFQIANSLDRIVAAGAGIASTLPLLGRLADRFRAIAITPQLAARAMAKWGDLTNRQARIVGKSVAQVRLGLLSAADAAAALVTLRIARTPTDAAKMISGLTKGAVAIPAPTAATLMWGAFSKQIAAAAKAIRDFLRLPVTEAFKKIGTGIFLIPLLTVISRTFTWLNSLQSLSTVLDKVLFKILSFIAVLYRITYFLAGFPALFTALVATLGPFLVFLGMGGPRAAGKFIVALLKLIHLTEVFSVFLIKVLVKSIGLTVQKIGAGISAVINYFPGLVDWLRVLKQTTLEFLDFVIEKLDIAIDYWRNYFDAVKVPAGQTGIALYADQFKAIAQSLIMFGRATPADILKALNEAIIDSASGMGMVTVAGNKYWLQLKEINKLKEDYQKTVDETAKQEREAALEQLKDIDKRRATELEQNKTRIQQINDQLEVELEASQKAGLDETERIKRQKAAWDWYYEERKKAELELAKFIAEATGDERAKLKAAHAVELEELFQRIEDPLQLQLTALKVIERQRGELADLERKEQTEILDRQISLLDVAAKKAKLDKSNVLERQLLERKAVLEAQKQAIELKAPETEAMIRQQKLSELTEEWKERAEKAYKDIAETKSLFAEGLSEEARAIDEINQKWDDSIHAVELLDATHATSEQKSKLIDDLNKRRTAEIEEKHKEFRLKDLDATIEKLKLQEDLIKRLNITAHSEEFLAAVRERATAEALKRSIELNDSEAYRLVLQEEMAKAVNDLLKKQIEGAEEVLKSNLRIATTEEQQIAAREAFIKKISEYLATVRATLEALKIPPEVIEQLDAFADGLRRGAEEGKEIGLVPGGWREAIREGLKSSGDVTEGFFTRVTRMVRDVVQNIRTQLSDTLFDWITGELNNLSDAFKGFLRSILRALTDFAAQEIVKWITDWLASILGKEDKTVKIPKIIADELRVKKIIVEEEEEEGEGEEKKKKSFWGSLKNMLTGGREGAIPRLQAGGLIRRPMIASLAERSPELVLPLEKLGGLGGGPVSVQFNISTLDPVSFHEYLSRNSRSLSSLIEKEILSNRTLRKTIYRAV